MFAIFRVVPCLLDEMGLRIDDLERNIAELINQAAADESATHQNR